MFSGKNCAVARKHESWTKVVIRNIAWRNRDVLPRTKNRKASSDDQLDIQPTWNQLPNVPVYACLLQVVVILLHILVCLFVML